MSSAYSFILWIHSLLSHFPWHHMIYVEQLVQGGVLGLPIDDIIGPSTFGDILGSSSFSKYDPMEDQEEGQEEDQEFTEL